MLPALLLLTMPSLSVSPSRSPAKMYILHSSSFLHLFSKAGHCPLGNLPSYPFQTNVRSLLCRLRSYTLGIDIPLLIVMVYWCYMAWALLSFLISIYTSLSLIHDCPVLLPRSVTSDSFRLLLATHCKEPIPSLLSLPPDSFSSQHT